MAGIAAGRISAALIASGFGSGYAPFAPGTAGSLAALLAGIPLLGWNRGALALAAILATVAGFWAVRRIGATGDPGWVVIDEVAGQWITMLALPGTSLPGLALAFALFRLLDVTKPGPVGWADRQPGALGVMLDDLIAGALAAAGILLLQLAWPGLI